MSRKPLHSYSVNMPALLPGITDSPMTPAISSTPPHQYTKGSHGLQTPVRTHDLTRKGDEFILRSDASVLLLPAFSSPQPSQAPVFDHGFDKAYGTHSNTHTHSHGAPTIFSAPVSDLDLPETRKKRPKKARRDESFSLDSAEKPPYSYATLIGMAILTKPQKQLTLLQIYLWILLTFKYYRREDVGWQNLIRHNLLLNKAFVKGAKSKDGKGHFWCIKPECEDQFLKAKNNKKSLYHEVMDQLALARAAHSLPPLLPTVPAKRTADDAQPTPKRAHHDFGTDSDSDTGPDSNNLLLRTPATVSIVTESPDKPVLAGKHLAFALSFSCSLNLELLPIPPLTGPLLEPLAHLAQLAPSSASASAPTPSQASPVVHVPIINRVTVLPRLTRTPKIRTPLRTLRTPLGSALVRRHWLLPLYLDDFYYLPFGLLRAVLNSYDDDDMLMRMFDSPAPRRGLLAELRAAEPRELDSRGANVDAD